jgi:hypothetical protein
MAETTGPGFPDEATCELAYGKGNCVKGKDGGWYLNALDAANNLSPPAPGIDWDPISWGKSALSDITGVFGATERWVMKQIVKAASLIENDIAKVYGYIASRFGGVENTISHLAGEINSTIRGIPHDITSTLADLRHDIAADVDAAVSGIKRGAGDVEGGVKALEHDAEHYADTAIADFKRDVLDPLERDLRRAIHDATSEAEHAWHVWYKDIWAPALHDLREAEHDAHKAVYFIDHSALDAIHLIDETWDFLSWVAKNPLKALEAFPAKMLSELTAAKLESQGTTITSGWAGLTKELDKKFPND